MTTRRKVWASPQAKKEWLARRIKEKQARRPDPGPAPEELRRTRFPFLALIHNEHGEIVREVVIEGYES